MFQPQPPLANVSTPLRSTSGSRVALTVAFVLGCCLQAWADDSADSVESANQVEPAVIEVAEPSAAIDEPSTVADQPSSVSESGAEAEEAAEPASVQVDSPSGDEPAVIDATPTGPVGLRFSFSGASWREVFSWLADESEMALHVGDVPPGSFTYSDPSVFSVDDAISQLNLFLIPQGFTLVRRDQLLSVISLSDPRSLQQLDAMASLVGLQDLDGRSEHEIVKCVFPLGEINASDATSELQPLMLMSAPVVLPRSNQLVITETVGKIKSVIEVLRALEVPAESESVQRFDLKHADFDTVMLVARSHLGLGMGDSQGTDISISSDISGRRLYVSGSAAQVDRFGELLKVLDVPDETTAPVTGMVLRSHRVSGDNLQSVYEVLQTILAGKSLRLSVQPKTSSVIALAEPDVHEEIRQTIEELQAPAVEFAVIDLRSLDPYFVVTLIEEMFETSSESRRDRGDEDDQAIPAPKVDADAGNRRLFVRGTEDQIAQIRQVIENLDTRSSRGESARVIPLRQNRQQLLEAATEFWRGRNRVQIVPSPESDGDELQVIERTIHPDQPLSADSDKASDSGTVPVKRDNSRPQEQWSDDTAADSTPVTRSYVSLTSDDSATPDEELDRRQGERLGRHSIAPIRSRLVPQGILIESDDLEALDEFQDHLMDVASVRTQMPSPPVVYYLKYVSADDAVKMLADLLDGGSSLDGPAAGSLVNAKGFGYSGRNSYGSLLFKREGMTTVTAGTATIVSDARLNRLIVQGTSDDVEVVEGYLKIIDKGTSLTNVETAGRTHIIELVHTKAEEVAEAIRQAYVGRIATDRNAAQANRDDDRRRGNNDRGRGDDDRQSVAEKPTRGREPEMAVAAHTGSNSVIITAPDALFREVEALVQSIDRGSEQSVEVISASPGVDLETILSTLGVEDSSNNRRRDRGRRSR